jgi:hypothetical protein
MVDAKRFRLSGPIVSLVVSLAVSAVITGFANWFDHLRPVALFFVVFVTVAIICTGIEEFYRRQYAADYVSAEHLQGLKETAALITDAIERKRTITMVNGKDCRDFFSHCGHNKKYRGIEKLCDQWDVAVFSCQNAQTVFRQMVEKSFRENGFEEPKINVPMFVNLYIQTTREREMGEQLGRGLRQQAPWRWELIPTDPDPEIPHDLFLVWGEDIRFARGIDDPDDPVDAEDVKKRAEEIFDNADKSPELVDAVKKELMLNFDPWVSELKELLHEFGLSTRLRQGRGCERCNS